MRSRSCGNWSPSNYGGGGGSGARMPLWSALARSLNTVATELSFAVGRDKVIEMTKRLGIEGVKKTCSMALGDGGITVLEHTGGFATFANAGKLARPYGILDITTSKGDLALFARTRRAAAAASRSPPRRGRNEHDAQSRRDAKAPPEPPNLDFTNVAGKTGTSTGPKDVWFVGFTGKYVAGVWLGNDDNHPMRAGVTGGHQAAPVWHDLMTVAHTDMNIPTIPGLAPHPRQIEEQQRLAEVKAAQVAAGIDTEASEAAAKSEKLMPEKTREALKTLTAALRKASGGGDVTPATPASMTSPSSQPPQSPPATIEYPGGAGRHAETGARAHSRQSRSPRDALRYVEGRPFDTGHSTVAGAAGSPRPSSRQRAAIGGARAWRRSRSGAMSLLRTRTWPAAWLAYCCAPSVSP